MHNSYSKLFIQSVRRKERENNYDSFSHESNPLLYLVTENLFIDDFLDLSRSKCSGAWSILFNLCFCCHWWTFGFLQMRNFYFRCSSRSSILSFSIRSNFSRIWCLFSYKKRISEVVTRQSILRSMNSSSLMISFDAKFTIPLLIVSLTFVYAIVQSAQFWI